MREHELVDDLDRLRLVEGATACRDQVSLDGALGAAEITHL